MRGERILLTGASGFLGAALRRRLAGAGAEVHGVARTAPGTPGPALPIHAVDLTDESASRALVDEVRPHRIFHLASLVTGRRDLDLVVPTLEANLAAAVHLMVAAAVTGGVERFVLAGSMEEPEGDEPPSSPYAAAKAAATAYARMFHAVYGLPVVTARIFMVYGPGQRDRTKVVPASILSALRGEAPAIGSGTRPIDWVYVDDVVEGLVALAGAEGVAGGRFDLGTGETATVREVVETICRLTGAPPPQVGAVADRRRETVRRADPAPTTEATGWAPRVGLEEGLSRTIESLRGELS